MEKLTFLWLSEAEIQQKLNLFEYFRGAAYFQAAKQTTKASGIVPARDASCYSAWDATFG